MKQVPLPISAIIVVYNEARRLRECLDSLAFCDEMIVVDLGSTDGSLDIAKASTATIISHPRLPVVEMILPNIAPKSRHNWVLRVDPDEVLPESLARDLRPLVEAQNDVGEITVPYQYYFKSTRLDHTIWGGTRQLPRLFRKDAVELVGRVHGGVRLMPGFTSAAIPHDGGNHVRHYWIDSWRQMFDKHRRYISQEGAGRYRDGQRFRWRGLAGSVLRALKLNFITHQAWRDGPIGVALGMFYAWYVAMSMLSLRRYQREQLASRPIDAGNEVPEISNLKSQI